jgi:hypothetical protein
MIRRAGILTIASLVGVASLATAQAPREARANPVSRATQPPVIAPVPRPAPDTTPKVLITREVFQYEGNARRDPFVSLLTTTDLRPMLVDLKLVAVAFDPRGQNSVAVLRDITSKQQYKVRVGQTIGRMRVAAIQEKAVIFTIEEFGYSRQEILPFVVDSTKMRSR